MRKSHAKQRRRNVPEGTRVVVCGHPVSGKHNLICLLPARPVHQIHSSIALDSEGFLVLVHRRTGGEPLMQGVSLPKDLAPESPTSPSQPLEAEEESST